MQDFCSIAQLAARVGRSATVVALVRLLVLAGLFSRPGYSWAQAPAWQLAVIGTNPLTVGSSYTRAVAVDAQGNVFITGNFDGLVSFGSIQLTGVRTNNDVFVAKWDATAQDFTWATSGGGTGADVGMGIAVSGSSIYVTGSFTSGSATTLAGQALPGAGGTDVFVAKFLDTSTGHTPATSSFANGWAIGNGGTGNDTGAGIAVNGPSVYVTGTFLSNSNARIAGSVLTGVGSNDLFVAKYLDTSTGNTTATSSVANGWATSGGGPSIDSGQGVAVSGQGVFVTGIFGAVAGVSVAGQTLAGVGVDDLFVAKYLDTSTGSTTATSSFANGWATSGGGPGGDAAYGIAVDGQGVFVTGYFQVGAGVVIAGQPLVGTGTIDMFVAKYVDTSTGNTTATSSFANGWATSGGGTGSDLGYGIAVLGRGVFVTGRFLANSNASMAGQFLPSNPAGTNADVFVAKYVDTSTGSTPATSSFANGWATSGGGPGIDTGFGIAVSGQQVYTGGTILPAATFGTIVLSYTSGGYSNFLAGLTDSALPLAAPAATAAGPGLTLAPNPARGGVATLRGSRPGTRVQVLDALGRVVATAIATAEGTATLALPAGLSGGVYVVRSGSQALRLVVE